MGANKLSRHLQCQYKAAVLSIGDILRLETHPFDVKVITLITGVIRTKFFDNMPPTRLPSDSIYAPIDAQLQKFVKGGEFGNGHGGRCVCGSRRRQCAVAFTQEPLLERP